MNNFDIEWHNSGREPECKPDPDYPEWSKTCGR